MDNLTYDERKVMAHTLGLDRGKKIYRNFFAAGPSHSDIPILDGLAAKGFMVKETSGISPDFIFRVTREGKAALLEYWNA